MAAEVTSRGRERQQTEADWNSGIILTSQIKVILGIIDGRGLGIISHFFCMSIVHLYMVLFTLEFYHLLSPFFACNYDSLAATMATCANRDVPLSAKAHGVTRRES